MQIATSDNLYIENHEQPESAPNEWMQKYRALSGKYEIVKPIGRGAQASVFLAKNRSGKKVAVKIFDFRDAEDWKSVELLEREVKTLKNLSLDGIPKYIEFIEDNPYFYLVESYIEADSLQKRIDDGWRPSEKQVWEILAAVSKRLAALHRMTPPIIHRDIKPANILLDTSKKTISVWIIDLGAVTEHRMKTHASTIAGTAGYAAPEQFMGRAMPASDIYGLGMTIIHLLSGKAPWEMEMDGLDVQYAPHLPQSISQDLRNLLEGMVKTDPKARISSAQNVYDIAIRHAQAKQNGAMQEASQASIQSSSQQNSVGNGVITSIFIALAGCCFMPYNSKVGIIIVAIAIVLMFFTYNRKTDNPDTQIASEKQIASVKQIASENIAADSKNPHSDAKQDGVPAVDSRSNMPVKSNPIVSILIVAFFIGSAIGILTGLSGLVIISLLPLFLLFIILMRKR